MRLRRRSEREGESYQGREIYRGNARRKRRKQVERYSNGMPIRPLKLQRPQINKRHFFRPRSNVRLLLLHHRIATYGCRAPLTTTSPFISLRTVFIFHVPSRLFLSFFFLFFTGTTLDLYRSRAHSRGHL